MGEASTRAIAEPCIYCSQLFHNPANNASEVNERTRLLTLTREPIRGDGFSQLGFGFLILLFFLGCSIGFYLIVIETKEWQVEGQYSLVPRFRWSIVPPRGVMPKLKRPSTSVLITETGGEDCDTFDECSEELQRLQTKHFNETEPDIKYNFLIGGNGKIFEGRGWNYAGHISGLKRDNVFLNTTVLVAFIGSFDTEQPNDKQVSQLEIFLKVANMRNRLVPCFKVLVEGGQNLIKISNHIQKKILRKEKCPEI